MNARAARRASNEQAGASRHSHAYPPSREELQRQVGRQQREIEKLRDQVAERDQRIADAEKRIADAEKLAVRQALRYWTTPGISTRLRRGMRSPTKPCVISVPQCFAMGPAPSKRDKALPCVTV